MTLTVGSLFSGIGGLELGLERAGMRTVWQVEKDEYCRRVLAKHWPDVQRFNDVREVGAHNLPPVDLICGGFPCQDISYAGKGAGLAGERSGLWYEFARIVREMEPRYVVVENVAALLARGLDAVLGTLASIGYDAEWDCISAAAIGAPHLRERVFVVAHARREGIYERRVAPNAQTQGSVEGGVERDGLSEGRGGEATPLADTERKRPAARTPHPVRKATLHNNDGNGAREEGRRFQFQPRTSWLDHWSAEPAVGRVANGVPSRVDRLRGLGNAVVPAVAQFIGELIVNADAETIGVEPQDPNTAGNAEREEGEGTPLDRGTAPGQEASAA